MFKTLSGLFYGWHRVGASAAVRLLGAGLHSYGFTAGRQLGRDHAAPTVESTYPFAWAMVGDIFGRKHFAKIRGYIGRGDSSIARTGQRPWPGGRRRHLGPLADL